MNSASEAVVPHDPLEAVRPRTVETIGAVAPKRLSLKRSFSWTLAGNLGYAFFQWLSLSLIAKFLTPEDVGVFGLGMAVSTPVLMLMNLQLRSVLATDASSECPFSDYLTLRILSNILGAVIILVIPLVGGYSADRFVIVLVVGVMKLAEATSDIYYGLCQSRHRLDIVTMSMIGKSVVGVLGMAALLSVIPDLRVATGALAAAWILTLFAYDIPAARRLLSSPSAEAPPDTRSLAERARSVSALFWRSAPLGLVTFLGGLTMNVQRFVIERYSGTREVGIYVALSYLLVIGNTVVLALGRPVSTALAGHYAAGDARAFDRLHRKFLLIAIGVGLLGALGSVYVGEFALTVLYSAEYAEFDRVLTILLLGGAIYYGSMAYGMSATAARAFKEQAVPQLGALVSMTAASLLLVPSYGLEGAAIASVVPSCVALVFMMRIKRRVMKGLQEREKYLALTGSR